MTNFVKLTDNTMIRADAIGIIGGWHKDGSRYLSDEEGRPLGRAHEQEIAEGTSTVLPAASGWRVCVLNPEGSEFDDWFEEIVAWQIDGLWSIATPITFNGDWQNNPHLLVSPQGAASNSDSSWDTLEEALDYYRKQREAAAA